MIKLKMMIKNLKIRTRILLIILTLSVTPVIFLSTWISIRVLKYMKRQNIEASTTTLSLISNNMDFIYNQYAMVFTDITRNENFHRIIREPQFTRIEDERTFGRRLGEDTLFPQGGTIRLSIHSKITGDFYIIELDKFSLINQTNFLVHYFEGQNLNIDIFKLISDPHFKKFEQPGIKMTFGKLAPGTIQSFEGDLRPVFIYPYREEGQTKITKFMMAVLSKNFIDSFYKSIDNIRFGTLFIVDSEDRIITSNHPSSDDYYTYNHTTKKYELNGDFRNPYGELLNYDDYSILVTNPLILENPDVKKILKEMENPNFSLRDDQRLIQFEKQKYILSVSYSDITQTKILYFYPLKKIYSPVIRIIGIIILLSLLLICIILLTSFIFSGTITYPLQLLTHASDELSRGKYKTLININQFNGDFLNLANSFNLMAFKLNYFNEKMEEMVKIRTFELDHRSRQLETFHNQTRHDLKLAQRIQLSMIPPDFPESEKIHFSGIYLPMDKLGGDLYDVQKLDSNRFCISVFDVCGHGASSALITSILKFTLKSLLNQNYDLKKTVEILNHEIHSVIDDVDDFVTTFIGIIDVKERKFQFVNTSQCPFFIIKKSGELVPLPYNSPFIGVYDNIHISVTEITLEEQDRILIYTDGVLEARNNMNELFGNDRITELIHKNRDLPIKDFSYHLLEEIIRFKNDKIMEDDITILVTDIL